MPAVDILPVAQPDLWCHARFRSSSPNWGPLTALAHMHNPYQAPAARFPEAESLVPPGKGWLLASLCLTVLTAITVSAVVPQFLPLFSSFGAELPWLSRVVVEGMLFVWLLPVCVVLAWFRWPRIRQRAFVAMSIGLLSLIVVLPLVIYAMYLPIFRLAETV